MAMSSREQYLYQARLAEQAERYEEMASFMQSLVETCINSENGELGVDERNLLSVAYKNYVGCRRASWRIIMSVEQKEKQNGLTSKEAIAKRYRDKIEDELLTVCTTVLKLIDEHLLPHAENAESKVFYYKMKGDYYRYISEFALEEHRDKASNEALQAYQTATDLADKLHPTHPIRLGLALNFSVFYYEIKNMPSQACEMAKKAFDEGIISFDHMPPDAYKDSTLIMQLLRDNLTLWTSDLQADTGEKANLEAEE